MIWNKYTIKTTTAAEDFIGSMLSELGIYSIEIEDNVPLSAADKEKMFIDILPSLPIDDGTAYVSFYLEEEADSDLIINQVKEGLGELSQMVDTGEASIISSKTEDKDWVNNWKQYFKSFVIDDILIKPTWEEAKGSEKYPYVIEIDPGTSFGTGKHETTQLCIRQLKKYMNESDTVLDVGSGSGILSIICLKLGAKQVTGIDVDHECMNAAAKNMEVNALSEEQGRFYQGNLIEDEQLKSKLGTDTYQVVVANILADIVIPLTPHILDCLKPGGYYITSGIIDFKENEVKEAMINAGLVITEITKQGEWVSITAKKQ